MNTFGKGWFALLVLANVGLVLWATGFRPAATPPEGPRPALHADKIRLLNEAGVQLQPRAARPPAGAAGCYRIGPFTDAVLADKAGDFLKEIPLAHERRIEEQQVVVGYRVYLPPLASREAAEQKRRELTRRGFKDHSLIQEEGLNNAISLGKFSVEANAQKHLQTLVAQGIKAQVQTLQQQRTFQWLYLNPAESLAGSLLRLRQTDWGSAKVKLEEASCTGGRN